MKKIAKRIFSLLLAGALLAGCAPNIGKAASLNRKSLTLPVESEYILTLDEEPVGKVKWTSSNRSVATVANGKVVARGVGKAVISAKYSGKTLNCSVKVKPRKGKAGTKYNPLSAYKPFKFTFYNEGKEVGKFKIKLERFVSGMPAAQLALNNVTNPVPAENEEYEYFRINLKYISGEQTINMNTVFNYNANVYGACVEQLVPINWGYYFEPLVEDIGTLTISPGNVITAGTAILVKKGYLPITYCIQTSAEGYTWFTTNK